MTLEHLRHLDDGAQTTPHAPRIPLAEELLGTHRIHMSPEPAEFLLDRPSPCHLQSVLPDGCEPASLGGREIGLVEEPELPRALEPVIVFGLEGLILGSPHLIDCLFKMFGDVELVVHELRIRGLVRDRIRIGREHVGSHGLHRLPLFDREGLQDRLRGGLSSLGDDVQHSRAVDVGEDGDVIVPSPKALVVDADVRMGFASRRSRPVPRPSR
jgi:hypothetical protein